MKKLAKIALNYQGNVLNEDEMQKILGGGSYTCYCQDEYDCRHVDTVLEGMSITSYLSAYCPPGGYCYLNNPDGGCGYPFDWRDKIFA